MNENAAKNDEGCDINVVGDRNRISGDSHGQKSVGDYQPSLDDNTSALAERLTRMEKLHEAVVQQLADIKQNVDITDNVHNNFRRILQLENEFLRELNKLDRTTISGLQKRIDALKSKLYEFGARAGLSRTKILAFVDTPEERHQISNGVDAVKTVYPFFFGVSEMLRQGFTKDDILQMIDRTRTATKTNDT